MSPEIKTSRPNIFPECATCPIADKKLQIGIKNAMLASDITDKMMGEDWPIDSVEASVSCVVRKPAPVFDRVKMSVYTRTRYKEGLLSPHYSDGEGVDCPGIKSAKLIGRPKKHTF